MKYVPPVGPTDRPIIAIVGEAPGADEERVGVPFVGPCGRRLNRMLQEAGIDRSQCYITNVAKERPHANNFAKRYYDEGNVKFPTAELLALHTDLRSELSRVRPSIVVPMGAEALFALIGSRSIGNYRGTLNFKYGFRIIPTYHPSYIMRGMEVDHPVVVADLKKAKRQALYPYKPVTNFNIDPSYDEVMAFLHAGHPRLAYDIETIKNHVQCIGFAWNKHDALVLPFMRGRGHRWSIEEEQEICVALAKLMGNPRVEKLLQNQMYDNTVLPTEYGFHPRGVRLDTMLGHHLLFPELPKGLDFLCSIYTDHPMYWEYDRSDWTQRATYCAMDCVVTYEAGDKIEEELKERGLWKFYQERVQPLTEILLYRQTRGVKIDETERLKQCAAVEKELEDIIKIIEHQCGFPVNPNSPKQVADLVYNKWQLPPQLHPKTRKPTADEDALAILGRKFPVRKPVIDNILLYRQKRVLKSTFLEMPLDDGVVKTSYNVGGTVTGRLASATTIYDIGGNLQNIPRGAFRAIFIARPGKVIIKADLSQAEYRVLIWKARINRVIDRWLTEPGFNIHMWNASENIYRVPVAQVTKTMYSNSKNGVYGANYGIGALKVSRMYNIDLADAKFIIDRYHAAVPEVKGVYQKEIEEALRTTRKIVNPHGRERVFMGQLDDETFRAAYSHYCQSTVADTINAALIDLHEEALARPEVGLDILLQVHDELVCECDENHVEEGVDMVRRAMEREMIIEGRPLTIPCDIKVGKDWYNTMDPAKWKEQQAA